MPNLLEQLENNEAVLLMYLAGELAEEDRDEVAQLLSTDARLAGDLERLRTALADVNAMVGMSDAHARLPIAESVAVRNTLRSMRRWRLEHPYRQRAVVVEKGLRYPWWAYPCSAAAMVLLAAVAWWGMRTEPGWQTARTGTFHAPPLVMDPASDPPREAVLAMDEFAQIDALDQAYSELRSIQELANGL